jgi:acetyltransferase-like isoleucine patch superfamily enzyme
MEEMPRNRAQRFPARLRPIVSRLWLYWRGFHLFLATLTGLIPSHRVRLFLYRAVFGIKIGGGSAIHWQCRFWEPGRITIGEHTVIGNNALLDGRYGLVIGDRVVMASEVAIYTLQHDVDDPFFGSVGGPVFVEDYAYVGPRVTILPGVRIGQGAVVSAGAVVTKDVAPFAIVGGVPAQFIRERQRDLRYKPGLRMPFQ